LFLGVLSIFYSFFGFIFPFSIEFFVFHFFALLEIMGPPFFEYVRYYNLEHYANFIVVETMRRKQNN